MSASEDEVSHSPDVPGSVHVVSDNDNTEFSGFDSPTLGANEEIRTSDLGPSIGNGKKHSKNVAKTPKEKTSKKKVTKNVKKGKNSIKSKKNKKNFSGIDFDTLSAADISILREKLGVNPTVSKKSKNPDICLVEDESSFVPDYNEYDYNELEFDNDENSRPNLRVEIDRNDISDAELEYDQSKAKNKNMSKSLLTAMFGSESEDSQEKTSVQDDWVMPQLKCVQKGKSISPSLASLINTACTTACETDNVVQKHPIPENCDKISPPLVNQEVWRILDKKSRSYDHLFVEIQSLLAAGIVPIIKLAEILKDIVSKNEKAKELISECLTLFGQAQYQLSLRRRFLIRPSIKNKYKNLCNSSTPISSKLFGDDIGKEIKNCEAQSSIALSRYDNRPYRARTGLRSTRRGRYAYHPYSNYGNFRGSYQQDYQSSRGSGYFRPSSRGRRRASATMTSVSAPNE